MVSSIVAYLSITMKLNHKQLMNHALTYMFVLVVYEIEQRTIVIDKKHVRLTYQII